MSTGGNDAGPGGGGDGPASWQPPTAGAGDAAAEWQPPAPGSGAPPGWGAPPTGRPPSNGTGIAALVLGILALLGTVFVLPALLGIVAVVLGIAGVRKANRGEATNKGVAVAGIVTGALAVLVGVIIAVAVGSFLTSDEFRDLTDCLENAETEADERACQREFEGDIEQ